MTALSDRAVDRLRRLATWPDPSGTRYRVQEVLGRGGMGTVYRASDEALGREVALKVVNAAGPHAELEARMRTEARVLAHLEHPGIVPIHDVGTLADGRIFYVMKYVRGETLAHWSRRPTDLAERLRVFERVCEPVAFAHAHGYVHRDLKPSNVMVGAFGEVLVMDWGVAKVLGRPEPPVTDRPPHDGPGTDPGTVLGTPGFMPPEQAAGDVDRVGPPADVYALGAMLLALLSDREPGADGAPIPRHPLGRLPGIPKRLTAICRVCLAPTPDARYPNAGALAQDVARFRAGHAVHAYPETLADRTARVAWRYRTPILLVVAYLIMRVLVAVAAG